MREGVPNEVVVGGGGGVGAEGRERQNHLTQTNFSRVKYNPNKLGVRCILNFT